MTATVAKPKAERRVSFTVPYACECGHSRAVFARGLATRLPASPRWRDTGPCAECGSTRRWRILDAPDAYTVEIEAPHG